jgi:SAM-dependent methyltransferase
VPRDPPDRWAKLSELTMTLTPNDRLRSCSQRFPYRLVLAVLPLHTIQTLQSESRLAWLRLTRRGPASRFTNAQDLLVNVGCGSAGLKDWVNIDCFRAEGVTLVRDCRTALPLPSGSARGVFTEHFLEHLDYYEEAPRFLSECIRVLQPGGVLRIIVPDGGKYLSAYCGAGLTAMRSFSPLTALDASSDDRPFSTLGEVVQFRTKMEVVNFHFRQSGQHRFSYDCETLSALLIDCGFEEVTERAFGLSAIDELAIDSPYRAPESLVIEAVAPKPSKVVIAGADQMESATSRPFNIWGRDRPTRGRGLTRQSTTLRH